jgi:hypothetical protein
LGEEAFDRATNQGAALSRDDATELGFAVAERIEAPRPGSNAV